MLAVRTPSGTFIVSSGGTGYGAGTPIRMHITLVSKQGQRSISPPGIDLERVSSLTRIGDSPCLGYESRGAPGVTCLRGDSWQDLPFSGTQRLLKMHPAVRCGDTLCVLAHEISAGGTSQRTVLRWETDRWAQFGTPLPKIDGVVGLGSPPDDAQDAGEPIAGVVQGPRPAKRRVLGYRDGAWVDIVKTHRADFGPLVVGPVPALGAIYMTTTDIARKPWTGGILRWAGEGKPRFMRLSRGFGDGQGEPSVVNRQLWVAWVETRLRGGRLANVLRDAEFWVAQLDPVTLRVKQRRKLWSGAIPSVSFPDVSVVDVDGKPHALWLKSRWRNGRPSANPMNLTTSAALERLDAR